MPGLHKDADWMTSCINGAVTDRVSQPYGVHRCTIMDPGFKEQSLDLSDYIFHLFYGEHRFQNWSSAHAEVSVNCVLIQPFININLTLLLPFLNLKTITRCPHRFPGGSGWNDLLQDRELLQEVIRCRTLASRSHQMSYISFTLLSCDLSKIVFIQKNVHVDECFLNLGHYYNYSNSGRLCKLLQQGVCPHLFAAGTTSCVSHCCSSAYSPGFCLFPCQLHLQCFCGDILCFSVSFL